MRGSERANNLPKVTELVIGGSGPRFSGSEPLFPGKAASWLFFLSLAPHESIGASMPSPKLTQNSKSIFMRLLNTELSGRGQQSVHTKIGEDRVMGSQGHCRFPVDQEGRLSVSLS